jgi:DNA adenine methylase
MSKKLIAFTYFGGKFMHADFVISKLPQTKSFVEVFGGSAVIMINKPPVQIETYNDINSRVVNFFKVLRENPDKLLEQIYLTPYAREEYIYDYNHINEGDELERARKFFVTVNQSFCGTTSRQTGWKMSTNETRANISEAISRWLSKIPNLQVIVERLRKIQITNFDFRVIFEKFDSPNTIFYCDPPYMHDVRCNNNDYEFEMSQQDHIELLNLAMSAKGKVAISGYDNELYNDLLKGFHKSIGPVKKVTLFHSERQEILWTNYDPLEAFGQSLFTKQAI